MYDAPSGLSASTRQVKVSRKADSHYVGRRPVISRSPARWPSSSQGARQDQVDAVRRVSNSFQEGNIGFKAADVAKNRPWSSPSSYGLGHRLIAVLIGGLGMMNTMVMAVSSRRARSACCARRLAAGHVLCLVASQSIVLSLLAGCLGVGMDWGWCG